MSDDLDSEVLKILRQQSKEDVDEILQQRAQIAALQAQVRVMGEALHNVREYINGRPPIRIASAVYEINKALAALILPAPPKEK